MSAKRIQYGGSLDMSTVVAFMDYVLLNARGQAEVILDLSELEFIDSTGVRSLVTLKQELGDQGQTLVLRGIRQDIIDILDILGVLELIVDK